jgi:hypothetical protein
MLDEVERVGWVEIYRTLATGKLVAVPSVFHNAPQYLHAETSGDKVVVTVKKRS